MDQTPSRTPTTPRAALAGLSALLVVGVLLGTSLQAAQPALREAVPSTARDRVPVRQFTLTLAKAVRELVGDHHKPAFQRSGLDSPEAAEAGATLPITRTVLPVRLAMVRVALLDLPPPAHA